jgi:O-6-methylguanine DNA methyltransferase
MPAIAVTLHHDGGRVLHVELALARQFELCVEGFGALPSDALRWIDAYREGESVPLPALAMPEKNRFVAKALWYLLTIPYGQTQSYKEVATALGNARAARAVGTACRLNPFPLFVPCHRVVGEGHLGGFSCGIEIKKRLLAHEQLSTTAAVAAASRR